MNLKKTSTVFLLIILFFCTKITAQEQLLQDYSQLMEIPDVIEMAASPTHLYILSESEGLAVFRTYENSLQWLFTSEGMQQRGDQILADIRFAYQFGDSRRLTVLEPTSVLGVYSSTVLPDKPLSAARINNILYIAMQDSGLASLSLETPETVDSDVQYLNLPELRNAKIQDLGSSITGRQLFVLTDDPALHIFNFEDGKLIHDSKINFRIAFEKIFIDDDKILASTSSGEVYEIRSSGAENKGRIGEPVSDILAWNDIIFVRGRSGKIQIIKPSGETMAWKTDGEAGNFIADSENQLWISENEHITQVYIGSDSEITQTTGNFKLKPISQRVLSYPEPLLLSLELEGDHDPSKVEFSYRSSADNAKIRKNGFYWQPNVNQIGMNWFMIYASSSDGKRDSTRFSVEVRTFNAPPQFSPVRPASIVVNETYKVTFQATDPEYPQSNLIRYIGVDLPMGSKLDERTGTFTWKPDDRQIGENTFRIIATDRSGAAASMDVTLRVLDISRGNGF